MTTPVRPRVSAHLPESLLVWGDVTLEDPEQRAWKGMAQVHMLEACAGRGRPVFPEGPVEIVILAYWPPTGQPRKRMPRPARWRAARPDADNTFKALADCSQGILVTDDAQYVRVVVEKWVAAQGEAARVEVRVRPLAGQEEDA